MRNRLFLSLVFFWCVSVGYILRFCLRACGADLYAFKCFCTCLFFWFFFGLGAFFFAAAARTRPLLHNKKIIYLSQKKSPAADFVCTRKSGIVSTKQNCQYRIRLMAEFPVSIRTGHMRSRRGSAAIRPPFPAYKQRRMLTELIWQCYNSDILAESRCNNSDIVIFTASSFWHQPEKSAAMKGGRRGGSVC